MITVAIPSNRNIQPQTAECVLNMVAQRGDIHPVVASEGYTIAENRNYLAVQAVNNGSSHLLMIDDDMTFETALLDKLLAVKQPIVGVAYHPRCDADRMKWLDETHHVSLDKTDDPKFKQPFKCHATGTGIVLIDCEVFKNVPRPWFDFEWQETGQCKKGEDWWFCEKAAKHGYETWTEPNITVGHLGDNILD